MPARRAGIAPSPKLAGQARGSARRRLGDHRYLVRSNAVSGLDADRHRRCVGNPARAHRCRPGSARPRARVPSSRSTVRHRRAHSTARRRGAGRPSQTARAGPVAQSRGDRAAQPTRPPPPPTIRSVACVDLRDAGNRRPGRDPENSWPMRNHTARRAALITLDQLPKGDLAAGTVFDGLKSGDAALRAAAL